MQSISTHLDNPVKEASVMLPEETLAWPACPQEAPEDEAGVRGVVAAEAVLVDGVEVVKQLCSRGEGEAEVP